MRTRSSRFFVILLHLLGVSNHHLPSWYYDYLTSTSESERGSFYSSGIRGVHPHSIVLERLDLKEVGGLDGVEWLGTTEVGAGAVASGDRSDSDSRRIRSSGSVSESKSDASSSIETTREPFWLQDSEDGKCLGPGGVFSECGDATLWFILRRGTQRKSLRMGPFGVEETLEHVNLEEPFRYALQIVDNDYEQQQQQQQMQQNAMVSDSTTDNQESRSIFSWRRKVSSSQKDCLVPSTSKTPSSPSLFLGAKPREDSSSSSNPLELGSCSRRKTAWSWRVDPDGVLYLPSDASTTNRKECLRRTQASSAVLSSCHSSTVEEEEASGDAAAQQRLVQFSLVRYHATATPTFSASAMSSPSSIGKLHSRVQRSPSSESNLSDKQKESPEPASSNDRERGLPHRVDIAHSHASDPVPHSPLFEMNLAGRPLLSTVPSREARKQSQSSPFAALKDSNPILFLGTAEPRQSQRKQQRRGMKAIGNNEHRKKGSTSPPPQLPPSPPVRLRKIEMNPYIAASKDEKWIDPQTGLEYRTDLCRYLGHDRKEYGRHTLVGVGQFTKTMLKIKVYGIAFYVSKRDVLADPSFQEYAGLSAEELRKRPDFYEKLRTMPPPGSDPSQGGFFDRTLFLKTNMQLSTETMRSSLDSDWKLLSEEDKALLIDTSMRPRPANEQMLAEIQRDDNPSRCSCSQTAPEELEADASCCARGIELVFTWRKNGDLEVRLNGRLMDSFPRPDIGNGIFFEYLRQDDPFSVDFLERVVDGFPFLLAPLAQVQGVTSSMMQQQASSVKADSSPNVLKILNGAAETVTSQAAGLGAALKHGASEITTNAVHAVGSAGDAMRHFAEEAERRREAFVEQAVHMSQQKPSVVIAQLIAKAKGEKEEEEAIEEPEEEIDVIDKVRVPHGRIFRPTTSQWFGETLEAPDEIAPMIHPTMNKTILSLVHLYLLLILVVSFPATNANRTRFVVRRSSKMMSASSSEASLRCGYERDAEHLEYRTRDIPALISEGRVETLNGRGEKADHPAQGRKKSLDCHPEDEDPAADGHVSEKVRIDLSPQSVNGRRRRRSWTGAKRFLGRSKKEPETTARSNNIGCSNSTSVASSLSEGGERGGRCCRLQNENSSEQQMQKSLSYFL